MNSKLISRFLKVIKIPKIRKVQIPLRYINYIKNKVAEIAKNTATKIKVKSKYNFKQLYFFEYRRNEKPCIYRVSGAAIGFVHKNTD